MDNRCPWLYAHYQITGHKVAIGGIKPRPPLLSAAGLIKIKSSAPPPGANVVNPPPSGSRHARAHPRCAAVSTVARPPPQSLSRLWSAASYTPSARSVGRRPHHVPDMCVFATLCWPTMDFQSAMETFAEAWVAANTKSADPTPNGPQVHTTDSIQPRLLLIKL